MKQARRWLAAACAALPFLSGTAFAFELLRTDGNPCGTARNLVWRSATAAVSIDPLAGTPEAGLVQQAMDTWNGTAARFRFTLSSGPRCNIDDRVAGVGWGETNCDGEGLGGALAITTSTFFTDTGELVDASVTLNANSGLLFDDAIFLQTALHELGHVLGLDHSDACGESGQGTLMRAVIIVGDPRLTAPQGDDIAGANFIYGGDNPLPPEGANSCAVGSGGGGGWVAASVLLAMTVAVRRRRRITRAASRCEARRWPARRRRDRGRRANR